MKRIFLSTLALTLGLGCTTAPKATDDAYPAKPAQTENLSAADSDPKKMGWMQGFPPSADKTIRFTDPDYFVFPKLRWTVCNFRQMMPTVSVDHGLSGARELPVELDEGIDKVGFEPLGGGEPMTWDTAFDVNYTDGILVMHHGRIVYERYAGCLTPHTLHGAMSVTKSLTGLLAEVLVAEGKLDEHALVGDLIPELKASAFGDATVRQVMDMTTGLDYSEDYSDPEAEVWVYAQAGSPLPKPKDYTGPRSYFEFLETVKKEGSHGDAFAYKTVNADTLGWLISRATNQSVANLLSERIWSPLGTEHAGFFTVDSLGTPFAGGGFNGTLRDMGRLGQMLLDDGQANGVQVIPTKAIESIRRHGDPETFAKAGYDLLPGWSYRSMWWVSNNAHGAYAARGVHGQTIWIDPVADMVIVRFASNPIAGNAASDPTSLPAYHAVAEYLMANDTAPLLGQEWKVEDIAGEGIIDSSHATLHFMADGRFAGSGTCNRLLGTYETDGDRLKMTPAGTTMMACAEALMNQEQKLLKFLAEIESYTTNDTGALLLKTKDGTTILLRR